MDDPRVTVLLPVRNGERFLRPAVDSVLRQTYPGYELLVVDDASTDGTGDILASYEDPRLRVVDNPGPYGFDAALNHGLTLARGEYLARMDADDVCVPERLARQVAFLDSHPEVGVVGGNVQPVDAHGHAVGHPARNLPMLPHHVRWRLFLYNCLNHPTVMVRTEALRAVGGYDPAAFPADDYDVWLRLASTTQVANLPDVLVEYRRHEASVTSTSDRHDKEAKELAVLSEAHGRTFGVRVGPPALAVLRATRPGHGEVGNQTFAEAVAALVRCTDACLSAPRVSREERRLIGRGAARRLTRMVAVGLAARPDGVSRPVLSATRNALRYLLLGEVGRMASAQERLWQELRSGR